ncbi:hypothetical protein HKI87_02g15250 [Chloropicon roscoffensis]|uniref:Uncharacterized protein n=1 Tax=Chloropicon roscoffensis TaxID=1461544 RepID=A0AAX4P137_9CHLO|mmetsp:Transcript_6075/g.20909  ORF Transcript_6075/g.20909 Transcript_6075/m.20909 type:complete len:182 (-) Transcript_6075:44-589(-)
MVWGRSHARAVEGTFSHDEVARNRRGAGAGEAKTGSHVTWESVSWKDGSKYEGLVKDGRCHVRGVLRYANGDRYEGEYKDNRMEGLGVYVWKNGAVYRGEWRKNDMHGCGVKLIPKGNGEIVPQEGEWLQDAYVGDVMACSKYASRKKAMEADAAALEARKLKPRDVGGEKSGGKKFFGLF